MFLSEVYALFGKNHEMQLYVKLLSGRVFSVDVDIDGTVADLKAIIQRDTNWKPESQRIIFAGRVLEGTATLKSYDLLSTTFIYLTLVEDANYPEQYDSVGEEDSEKIELKEVLKLLEYSDVDLGKLKRTGDTTAPYSFGDNTRYVRRVNLATEITSCRKKSLHVHKPTNLSSFKVKWTIHIYTRFATILRCSVATCSASCLSAATCQNATIFKLCSFVE